MHRVKNQAERTVDQTGWYEQVITDGGSSIDSTQTSDRPLLTPEMAIEWAHLGGD